VTVLSASRQRRNDKHSRTPTTFNSSLRNEDQLRPPPGLERPAKISPTLRVDSLIEIETDMSCLLVGDVYKAEGTSC
jgi:hypothetical protein